MIMRALTSTERVMHDSDFNFFRKNDAVVSIWREAYLLNVR